MHGGKVILKKEKRSRRCASSWQYLVTHKNGIVNNISAPPVQDDVEMEGSLWREYRAAKASNEPYGLRDPFVGPPREQRDKDGK